MSRNENVDLLRIMACFAVVGLHTVGSYLFDFAVPMFFAISGFFLLNRREVTRNYATRKIKGILKLVLCWNLVILLYNVLHVENSRLNMVLYLPIDCFYSVLQRGMLWQLWYLGALLIMYLILPFVSMSSCDEKIQAFLLCVVISEFVQVVSMIQGKPVQSYICQTLRIWTWVMYLLLGGALPLICSKVKASISLRWHGLIAGMYTLLTWAYKNYVGVHILGRVDANRVAPEYIYDSLSEVIWIVLIFSFVVRLRLPEKAKYIISFVAPLTLGVYIIHPILIEPLIRRFGSVIQIGSPLLLGAVFIGAILISYIISLTPLKMLLLKL